jgi:hypothetical protein
MVCRKSRLVTGILKTGRIVVGRTDNDGLKVHYVHHMRYTEEPYEFKVLSQKPLRVEMVLVPPVVRTPEDSRVYEVRNKDRIIKLN